MSKKEPKWNSYLKRVVKKILYMFDLRGIGFEEQRTIVRLSRASYYNRRRNPGTFRLEEVARMADELGVEVWELLKPDEVVL